MERSPGADGGDHVDRASEAAWDKTGLCCVHVYSLTPLLTQVLQQELGHRSVLVLSRHMKGAQARRVLLRRARSVMEKHARRLLVASLEAKPVLM